MIIRLTHIVIKSYEKACTSDQRACLAHPMVHVRFRRFVSSWENRMRVGSLGESQVGKHGNLCMKQTRVYSRREGTGWDRHGVETSKFVESVNLDMSMICSCTNLCRRECQCLSSGACASRHQYDS